MTGWMVGDILVHPVAAYTNTRYWFDDFEALFPDKAKRMREYSAKQGWQLCHYDKWFSVVIDWLNKNWGR